MKRKNKGFSFVELLATIAILGVLAAVLVPALGASFGGTDHKRDDVAVSNLQSTLQVALQHNSMYKNAKNIVDDTSNKQLLIVYQVNDDNQLVLDRCEAIDKTNGKTTNYDDDDLAKELDDLRSDIIDFINGKMEPIEIQSETYAERGYYFIATFPDVDYRVNVELSEAMFEATVNSSLASPGLHGGTINNGSEWVFPSGGGLHLHTGYNGLAGSDLGDVWKVTLIGDNLSKFEVSHSYYKDGQGWTSGSGTYSNITKTNTMFEFYFTSNETWPKIGFMIYNYGDEATVSSVQFAKVG